MSNLSFSSGSNVRNLSWKQTRYFKRQSLPPLQNFLQSELAYAHLDSKIEVFQKMNKNKQQFMQQENSHISNFKKIQHSLLRHQRHAQASEMAQSRVFYRNEMEQLKSNVARNYSSKNRPQFSKPQFLLKDFSGDMEPQQDFLKAQVGFYPGARQES